MCRWTTSSASLGNTRRRRRSPPQQRVTETVALPHPPAKRGSLLSGDLAIVDLYLMPLIMALARASADQRESRRQMEQLLASVGFLEALIGPEDDVSLADCALARDRFVARSRALQAGTRLPRDAALRSLILKAGSYCSLCERVPPDSAITG